MSNMYRKTEHFIIRWSFLSHSVCNSVVSFLVETESCSWNRVVLYDSYTLLAHFRCSTDPKVFPDPRITVNFSYFPSVSRDEPLDVPFSQNRGDSGGVLIVSYPSDKVHPLLPVETLKVPTIKGSDLEGNEIEIFPTHERSTR